MKLRYLIFTGVVIMVGWNLFLIQRDDAMYKAYYRHQAVENMKKPISSETR